MHCLQVLLEIQVHASLQVFTNDRDFVNIGLSEFLNCNHMSPVHTVFQESPQEKIRDTKFSSRRSCDVTKMRDDNTSEQTLNNTYIISCGVGCCSIVLKMKLVSQFQGILGVAWQRILTSWSELTVYPLLCTKNMAQRSQRP